MFEGLKLTKKKVPVRIKMSKSLWKFKDKAKMAATDLYKECQK